MLSRKQVMMDEYQSRWIEKNKGEFSMSALVRFAVDLFIEAMVKNNGLKGIDKKALEKEKFDVLFLLRSKNAL